MQLLNFQAFFQDHTNVSKRTYSFHGDKQSTQLKIDVSTVKKGNSHEKKLKFKNIRNFLLN